MIGAPEDDGTPEHAMAADPELPGQAITEPVVEHPARALIPAPTDSVDGVISILEKNHVSPSSVHVVSLAFPTMPAALSSGKIDAVTEVEPFVAEIQAQGGKKLSPLFEGMAPSLVVAGYFANTHEISKDPALVRRFVTAINQSLAYARTHTAAVRAIIPTYTKIPSSVAKKMPPPVWSAALNEADIQVQEKLMAKLHWINKPVALSKLIWSGAKS